MELNLLMQQTILGIPSFLFDEISEREINEQIAALTAKGHIILSTAIKLQKELNPPDFDEIYTGLTTRLRSLIYDDIFNLSHSIRPVRAKPENGDIVGMLNFSHIRGECYVLLGQNRETSAWECFGGQVNGEQTYHEAVAAQVRTSSGEQMSPSADSIRYHPFAQVTVGEETRKIYHLSISPHPFFKVSELRDVKTFSEIAWIKLANLLTPSETNNFNAEIWEETTSARRSSSKSQKIKLSPELRNVFLSPIANNLLCAILSKTPTLPEGLEQIKHSLASTIYNGTLVSNELFALRKASKNRSYNPVLDKYIIGMESENNDSVFEDVKPSDYTLSEIHLDGLFDVQPSFPLGLKINRLTERLSNIYRQASYFNSELQSHLLAMIEKERVMQKKGYLSCVHAVPWGIYLIYEIIHQVTNILQGEYHASPKFRFSEQPFLEIPTIEQFKSFYLEKFDFKETLRPDDQDGFSKQVLSVNLFLAGSLDNPGSSSLALFLKNRDSRKQNTEQTITMVNGFLTMMALSSSQKTYLLELLSSLIDKTKDCGGVLYQIHIPYQQVDESIYFAKAGGFQYSNYQPSEMISKFYKEKIPPKFIEDLQARLFMSPENLKNIKTSIYQHRLSPESRQLLEDFLSIFGKIVFTAILKSQNINRFVLQRPVKSTIYNRALFEITGVTHNEQYDDTWKLLEIICNSGKGFPLSGSHLLQLQPNLLADPHAATKIRVLINNKHHFKKFLKSLNELQWRLILEILEKNLDLLNDIEYVDFLFTARGIPESSRSCATLLSHFASLIYNFSDFKKIYDQLCLSQQNILITLSPHFFPRIVDNNKQLIDLLAILIPPQRVALITNNIECIQQIKEGNVDSKIFDYFRDVNLSDNASILLYLKRSIKNPTDLKNGLTVFEAHKETFVKIIDTLNDDFFKSIKTIDDFLVVMDCLNSEQKQRIILRIPVCLYMPISNLIFILESVDEATRGILFESLLTLRAFPLLITSPACFDQISKFFHDKQLRILWKQIKGNMDAYAEDYDSYLRNHLDERFIKRLTPGQQEIIRTSQHRYQCENSGISVRKLIDVSLYLANSNEELLCLLQVFSQEQCHSFIRELPNLLKYVKSIEDLIFWGANLNRAKFRLIYEAAQPWLIDIIEKDPEKLPLLDIYLTETQRTRIKELLEVNTILQKILPAQMPLMLIRNLAYYLINGDDKEIKSNLDKIFSHANSFWPKMVTFFSSKKPIDRLLDSLSNLKPEYRLKINTALSLKLCGEAVIRPQVIKNALEKYVHNMSILTNNDSQKSNFCPS